MNRALITGATGFIGSNLAKFLIRKGWKVYGASRNDAGNHHVTSLGAIPVRLKLGERCIDGSFQDLPEVDVVYHLAGKLSGSRRELFEVNANGTHRLAQMYARQLKSPIFVYTSSVAASGPSNGWEPRLESHAPKPVSDYGASKLAGENSLRSFADQMAISIVRPGIVFGDGDREFQNLLYVISKFRINPVIGWGDTPVAFIEVCDLVRIMTLVAEKGERLGSPLPDASTGFWNSIGIYNAADARPLALNSLSLLYQQVTGRRVIPLMLPAAVGYALACASEMLSSVCGFKTTLTRDKIREAMSPGWAVDTKKSIYSLNWRPQQNIEDTMKAWIRLSINRGLI
jgi:nucleoside-diphosphate-sugar epimerase